METPTNSKVNSSNSSAEDKIEFLRTLRQVRRFTGEQVPDEAIQGILEVARWSGSAGNTQPWDLVVITDPQVKKGFEQFLPYIHVANASFGIIIAMQDKNPPIETYDEGRLTERLLLAAHAYGVGAGIGWPRGEDSAKIKEMLGIPQDRKVMTTLGFGYEDGEAERSRTKMAAGGRKPLEELAHWNKF